MSNGWTNLFKKLKSIKHIELLLALLIGVILLLVYFSSSNSTTGENNIQLSGSEVSSYTHEIETKLANILEKINGAGEVDVMVMVENETETDVESLPNISSVIIVSSGAGDVKVKLEIVKAVQALLSIKSSNIEVLEGGA